MAILDQITRFLDPTALAIVGGGAFLVAAMRSTRDDITRAVRALGPLFAADPAADGHCARVAVGRIAAIAEVRHISCADRVRTAQAYLRRIAAQLADAPSADAFAHWAESELAARRARHAAAQDFWRAAADAAPAMGMIGTIVGLIEMFAGMDDPARIGPAMALALLTTLYGVVLANAVAGPIAARLERLSAGELAWQRDAIDRLETIARAELPLREARPLNHLRPVA